MIKQNCKFECQKLKLKNVNKGKALCGGYQKSLVMLEEQEKTYYSKTNWEVTSSKKKFQLQGVE
jgi:hypothetical protein